MEYGMYMHMEEAPSPGFRPKQNADHVNVLRTCTLSISEAEARLGVGVIGNFQAFTGRCMGNVAPKYFVRARVNSIGSTERSSRSGQGRRAWLLFD
jgi:hypothetical protein